MAGTSASPAAVRRKNVGKKRGPYKPRQKPAKSDDDDMMDARDRSNIGADPSRGGSRGYDVHFRRRALELADGVGMDEAALQLGVSVGSMYRWRRRIIPYKMTGGRQKKKKREGEEGGAASSSAAATTTEEDDDDQGEDDDDDMHQEDYDDDDGAAAAAAYQNDCGFHAEMHMALDGGTSSPSSGQPTTDDDEMLLLGGGSRDASSDPFQDGGHAAASVAAAALGGTSEEAASAASAAAAAGGEANDDGRPASTDADASSVPMLNTNGGSYRHGSAFSYEKKRQVAALYRELLKREGGGDGASPMAMAAATNRVTHRMLASEAKVSKGYAQKVLHELKEHGDVLPPGPVPGAKKTGPGSRSLTHFDQVVLMQLHAENPYRMLQSYKQELFLRTGTHASETSISRWLQSMFPHESRAASGGHGGSGGGNGAARKRPPAQQQQQQQQQTQDAAMSLLSASSTSSSTTASPRKRRPKASAASLAPSLLNPPPSFDAFSDGTGASTSADLPAPLAQEGSGSTSTALSTQQQLSPGTLQGDTMTGVGGATASDGGAVASRPPVLAPAKPTSKRARAAATKAAPVPVPVPAAAAAAEQLRTQLEARLLEAAYFVRPLPTAAALTSRSPGHECFPKRHVRNAYEYLLQHPDDARRFVTSFEKSGIGLALVQAAAVGVEGVAASPYGMLVELCAAGYVNRIVSCGKQAAITHPNAAAAAAAAKPKAITPGQCNGPAISQPKPPPPQQPSPTVRTIAPQQTNNEV
jgi:hypothetical protein